MTEPTAPAVATDPPSPQASAWHRPEFRALARGWFAVNVADSALFLMAAVWVKDLTGSDAAAAAVLAAYGLPAIAAPWIGQWVDRASRRRLMIVAATTMVPLVLSLLLVGPVAGVWLVYVVIVVYGAVGYLVTAAQAGLVRDLLPDEELASGNGVLTTIDMGLRLVSPLLGAGLYALAGGPAVVVLTAASFAVAALLLVRVRVEETPPTPDEELGSYWHELTAGFRHLAATAPLGRLTIVLAVGFGAAGVVNAAVFPAMEQGFGVDAAMLGLLTSLQGAGAVAGGVLAARLIARVGETRALALGVLLIGLGIVPFAGNSLALGAVGMVVIGMGIPWVVVAFATLRQRLTPPRLQGRTAAATNLALNVPSTAATFATAAALGVVDYRLLVLGTCGLLVASALAAVAGRRGTPEAGVGSAS